MLGALGVISGPTELTHKLGLFLLPSTKRKRKPLVWVWDETDGAGAEAGVHRAGHGAGQEMRDCWWGCWLVLWLESSFLQPWMEGGSSCQWFLGLEQQTQEATTTEQMYVIAFWGHAAPGVSPKLPGIEQVLGAGTATWPRACPGASARKISLGGGLILLRAHAEHAAVQTAAGCTRDSPSLLPEACLSPTCTSYRSSPPETHFWHN